MRGRHLLAAQSPRHPRPGRRGDGGGQGLGHLVDDPGPAARAGLVQVWALDPRLMELSFGRSLFGDRYAATPEGCVALLEAAVKVMQERNDHRPSQPA